MRNLRKWRIVAIVVVASLLTAALAACAGGTSTVTTTATRTVVAPGTQTATVTVTITKTVTAIPTPAPTPTPTPTPSPTPTPTPSPSPKPPGPLKAKLIEPQWDGTAISIPRDMVQNNWNTRFRWQTEDGSTNFMAYVVNGEIQVRANVCPPCGSIGFSLKDAVLICDTCATTFNARTGAGIKGACVNYPKAAVPYEINGAALVMKTADLLTAYQNTLKPGWP